MAELLLQQANGAPVLDDVTAAAIRVLSIQPTTPASAPEVGYPNTPTSVVLLDPVTSICVLSAYKSIAAKEEGFEGNEKRLQIDLKPDGSTGPLKLNREFWDKVLDKVSAKILDFQCTSLMEGYILSESSLFVSANRITLITCGTTVLLGCLQMLVDGITSLGREIEYLQYSRKDFTYPWQQQAEHKSIASEYAILQQCCPAGAPFILGPLDRDHYFMYVMDNITRPSRDEVDMQLNIVMYDISEEVSKEFYSDVVSTNSEITSGIRKRTGFGKLFESCEVVQDQIWHPCGYSANAWKGIEYWTTHITPERHCSYASFETNASYPTYTPLVLEVLDVFKPQRCTLIMLIDEESPAGKQRREGHDIGAGKYPGYSISGRTINEFGPGYYVIKTDLILQESKNLNQG